MKLPQVKRRISVLAWFLMFISMELFITINYCNHNKQERKGDYHAGTISERPNETV